MRVLNRLKRRLLNSLRTLKAFRPSIYFRQGIIRSVFLFLTDILKTSSIHGLHNLARTNIHWIEFLFWLFSILSMSIGAVHLAVGLIAQYKQNNVAVTIDIDYTTWNTTKPSFTFCPPTILDRLKIKGFIKERELKTEVSDEDLTVFLQQLSSMSISNIEPLKDLNYGISPNDYMELIFNLSRHDVLRMDKLNLIRTVSDVGICYTHNNILVEDGTSSVHWGDHLPPPENRSTTSSLVNYHFFNEFPEFHFLIYGQSQLRTFVHPPYEMPTTWSHPIRESNPKSPLLLSIRMTEVNYESNLISDTTVEQRQCRTHKESNLRMFPRTYSRFLCLMECRAVFALKHCHCIPHFYDRREFRKSQKMNICDVKGLNCLGKYKNQLKNLQSSKNETFECACLQNCNLLEIYTDQFARRINLGALGDLKIFNAHIQLSPQQQYRRSVIFTTMDFAVAIGSVLGVFLGCCVLSFIEIVYFFTFRLYWFSHGYRGAVPPINN